MSIPEVEVRHTTETRYPERRRLSGRSVIEAAKEIPTLDLADRLCGPGQMRRVGKQWTALCPLPDHQERTPSFTVDPAKDVWWCFGCLRGGDVVELARFAWGYDKHGAAMAAADLLHEFGHPIPEKPASWYGKQQRQKPMRDALQAAKIRHLQRRVFRIFLPMIEELEEEDERREEAEYLWRAAEQLAVLMWAGRRSA
jgi:hypothetical protein